MKKILTLSVALTMIASLCACGSESDNSASEKSESTTAAENLTSAELSSAVEKECGNLDDILAKGEFEKINNWLRENIFRFGALYTPDELLERSIKKEVEANSYLNYLKRKVGD